MGDLHNIRREYNKGILDENNLPDHPNTLFDKWLQEAINANITEPTAMTLSTVSESKPSSRIVLLKDFQNGSFIFYTNYQSRKGLEIVNNPHGALNFFWPEFERQIRIEGSISKLNSDLSDKYFLKRPVQSQISAIVSPQSKKINNKAIILNMFNSFKHEEILKRPEYWGGYQLDARYFEFWQGRENRLHDRFEFILKNDNWVINRLAP